MTYKNRGTLMITTSVHSPRLSCPRGASNMSRKKQIVGLRGCNLRNPTQGSRGFVPWVGSGGGLLRKPDLV